MDHKRVRAFLAALGLLTAPGAFAQEAERFAPSITEPAIRDLIASAEAIDMEQDPAGARTAWQAVFDAADAAGTLEPADRASILNQLGSAIFYAGGREEALGYFQDASAIFAQAGPQYRTPLEESLGNAASILGSLGRLDEAEAVHRQVLDIRRELYPENHVQVARSYFELGVILNARGDIDGARELVERSLAIREAVLEEGHPHIQMTKVSLAAILIRAFRFADAAALSREASETLEATLPAGHPFIGFARSSYAGALNAAGRYEAAEPLLRAIVEERRASLGDAHPQVADTLNNLGVSLYGQGRAAEARPLFIAARDIYRATASDASVEAARMQMNAGDTAFAAGDYEAARAEWLDVLSVFDASGATGPDRIRVLAELAALEALAGNAQAARQYHDEAAELSRSLLPEGHARRHELAIDEAWIASLSDAPAGEIPQELDNAVTALAADLSLSDIDSARELARERQRAFRRALDVAYAAGDASSALRYLQLVHATHMALAAEASALRADTASAESASALRARQDDWRALRLAENAYIRARTETSGEADLASARTAYEEARARLDSSQSASGPSAGYETEPAEALRAALGDNETVIAFAFTEGGGVAMRLSRDTIVMDRLAITSEEASEAVTRLRASLEAGSAAQALRPFPADDAHALYAGVFTPQMRDGLQPGTTLAILADGAYQAIPFPVLLSAEVSDPMTTPEDYRAAPWLIRDHGVTTLAAFSTLTRRESADGAREPFLIGFGAPVFSGSDESEPMLLASVLRSSGEEQLRALSSLSPLPGARAELAELAAIFGEGRADVRLGLWATETAVKRADLSRASMLVFATHGLLPGELETVHEPALAFTPPDLPGEGDDGLLTASEIAQLNLNADWVVLSACNTFAAGGSARAPDRLAQAFLYAGARSLLVSHWTVRDDAAAALTAGTARRALAGATRPEAFRESVLALMQDETVEGGAHPGVWGPFALIGQ
ncbi:MAG: CHAT domain-containing protein [Caulobacterales bacterium]|uniref:CHAT domain-containing protein n=1 Tax=Glycocaulis sp. TaxID=1969725 RepID=UPI003FA19534